MRSALTDDDLAEIEARIKPGDWLWNAHSPADALALLHEVRRLQALIDAAACPDDGGLMASEPSTPGELGWLQQQAAYVMEALTTRYADREGYYPDKFFIRVHNLAQCVPALVAEVRTLQDEAQRVQAQRPAPGAPDA